MVSSSQFSERLVIAAVAHQL